VKCPKLQPKPFQTSQAINLALLCSAVAYAFLLIPTVMVHLQAASGHVDVSRLMDLPWSEILSLSKKWKWLIDFGIVLVGGLTTWLYWRLLLTALQPHSGVQLKSTLLWTAVFAVILSGVIPFHSRDVFGYINRGAEQVVYGVNPYLVPVEGIKTWHEDLLFHEHWIHNPCPYGFFFAQATAWMVALGGKTFWGSFLVAKGLNVILFLGLTFLIYQTVLRQSALRLSGQQPSLTAKNQALFAAMMFGCNPLMLMQLVGNGHNDLWVGGGLVLTFFFAISEKQRHWMWPVFLLTALVKYTVLLLLPVLLVWTWINRTQLKWGQAIFLSLFTVGFSIWPYAADLPHFPWDKILENATLSQHSFHSALSRTVQYLGVGLLGWDMDLEQVRKGIKWLLCAVVIGVLFVSIKRMRIASKNNPLSDSESLNSEGHEGLLSDAYTGKTSLQNALLWAMTALMVSFLLVASAKFHAWYIGSFFPLLCLFPKGHFFQRLGLWLSVSQLGAFTFLENVHILNALLLNGLPLYLACQDTQKSVTNC
jgi:hypothetical protein